MKNVYYMIWVDGLLKFKSLPQNKNSWKFYGMIFISMAMAMNLGTIIIVISLLGFNTFNNSINFDIFPVQKLNDALKFFLLYLFPFISINYITIFRNNRYEKLFLKYKSFNGKLCASYMVVSYFLPLLVIFGGYLIKKLFF